MRHHGDITRRLGDGCREHLRELLGVVGHRSPDAREFGCQLGAILRDDLLVALCAVDSLLQQLDARATLVPDTRLRALHRLGRQPLLAHGVAEPAVGARQPGTCRRHGVLREPQLECRGERLDRIVQARDRRRLGAGRVERRDRLVDPTQRIGLLPQIDYVPVRGVELRELFDGCLGAREGARLVEHEPTEQGVEGAQILRRLGFVQKLERCVSPEPELADDPLMEAPVPSTRGDQRIWEGLRHAASVDAALDVRLHVEKPHLTAGSRSHIGSHLPDPHRMGFASRPPRPAPETRRTHRGRRGSPEPPPAGSS